MADQSPNVTRPQNGNTKADNQHAANAAITPEQVRAITDRVYDMLLRDLKRERERDHITVWNSRTFKRG